MARFSEALLADLARSGLTAEDAERLHLEDMGTEESMRLGFGGRLGYKIPYFDIKGNVTDYYRIRFLDDSEKLKKLREEDAPRRMWIKYSQPFGAAPELYLPPYVNWEPFLAGHEGHKSPLGMTEGEKKSVVSSKAGLPMIGLGGVWGWSSHKLLLPSFGLFDWKGRDVYLIFDSDIMSNQQVRAALHALARELSVLGAKPFTVVLPDGSDGSKTGIDDFIVRAGVDAFFTEIKNKREPFDEITEFWKLNDEYAVIISPPSIYKFGNKELYRKDDFVKIVEGARRMVWKDAAGKDSLVYAADKWLQWGGRRHYARLDYLPGQPVELPDGGYNLWPGLTAEPVQGDVSWWMELLDHVFAGDAEARHYFECWCAYPIKHPGTKLYVASILWGRETGCGKSLIGYVLGDLYGQNYAEINQDQLHGSFNEWSRHKQFILAEEVANSDKRADAGKLKSMITRDKVAVNAKYKPEYIIRDTVNYLFTSNEPDAMFFVRQDRRYFTHRIEAKLAPERGHAIRQHSMSVEGRAALHFHFINFDTGDFDPRAAAIMTRAKADMIEAGWSDLDRWADKLAHNPQLTLSGGASGFELRDLWTTEELAGVCDFDRTPTLKALSNSLARAGIEQTPRMGAELGGVKLWIVANVSYWLTKSPEELAAAYNSKAKAPKF